MSEGSQSRGCVLGLAFDILRLKIGSFSRTLVVAVDDVWYGSYQEGLAAQGSREGPDFFITL